MFMKKWQKNCKFLSDFFNFYFNKDVAIYSSQVSTCLRLTNMRLKSHLGNQWWLSAIFDINIRLVTSSIWDNEYNVYNVENKEVIKVVKYSMKKSNERKPTKFCCNECGFSIINWSLLLLANLKYDFHFDQFDHIISSKTKH